MLILMAGLPGSGKSTLCGELVTRLTATILDKDTIRAALFRPQQVEYSTEQDDFCMKVMLETASYILSKDPEHFVFLDGRPFSRHYQIEQAIDTANALKQPWRILECVCLEATAKQRLQAQTSTGEHPAANRDFRLYLQVKAKFEPITFPTTIINTDEPLEVCVSLALKCLR